MMSEIREQGRFAVPCCAGGRRIARLFWVGMVLCAVLCAGLLPTAWAGPVPNLKFKDLAGHTERLASLRGKITVVNFWATWCAPCREEMPMLSALNGQYASRGVQFVAISVDTPADRAKIAPFLAGQKIALPVWAGADLDTLEQLGFGNVVPATLVLDAKGDPVGRIEGEAREADVRGYLDWLLSGSRGQSPAKMIRRY